MTLSPSLGHNSTTFTQDPIPQNRYNCKELTQLDTTYATQHSSYTLSERTHIPRRLCLFLWSRLNHKVPFIFIRLFWVSTPRSCSKIIGHIYILATGSTFFTSREIFIQSDILPMNNGNWWFINDTSFKTNPGADRVGKQTSCFFNHGHNLTFQHIIW